MSNPAVKNHDPSKDWEDAEINPIARYFRISKETTLRRLLILKLASSDNYANLLRLWRSCPPPTLPVREIKEKGFEKVLRLQGKPYVNLILEAYQQGQISERDISDYLDMKLKHLTALQEIQS